jgi:ribokinase
LHPSITVVGSLNADQVIRAPNLPEVGETVSGGEFAVFAGGKGANQAVAAARLGARVSMVGRVGDDPLGPPLRDGLAAEGIDVSQVRAVPGTATGVAFITVDPSGRNTIVVAGGANLRLSAADVESASELIAASRLLLLQLEVPMDAVVRAAELARAGGCLLVLDPAPARPVPAGLYPLVSVINPNQVEARLLTGTDAADDRGAAAAAARLLEMGCGAAVIKMGERGAYVATRSVRQSVPGIPVEAVDSTAAGDAFAAALGVALAEGKDLARAARFANAVAALSVTRAGAQPSMPTRAEVGSFAGARGLVI